jgi:hypothetical protein
MARGQAFSYTTVHELFTKTKDAVPRLPVLMDVVEMLARTAPRTNVEETLAARDAARTRHTASARLRNFVLGRDRAFSAAEMALAHRIWRLLIGNR